MRRFWLYRDEDETGISGCGPVAEGVLFGNGKVSITWRTEHTSVATYDDMKTVEAIHGHGGKTRVIWLDPLRDPQREIGEGFADVARDRVGEPIREGMLVFPLKLMGLEREPYYVTRTYRVGGDAEDRRWMVSSLGWPECGYGLGGEYADLLRVVGTSEE